MALLLATISPGQRSSKCIVIESTRVLGTVVVLPQGPCRQHM